MTPREQAAIPSQIRGDFGQPAADHGLPWWLARPPAAARSCGRAAGTSPAARPRPVSVTVLQPPAMDRVQGASDGAVALQIADDDADGLRCLRRDPREVGARQARMGRAASSAPRICGGDAEVGQRALHRQSRDAAAPGARGRRG